MSEHVYKKIEITGSSNESSDQSVRNALAKAAETVEDIDWFEIDETRGQVVDKKLKFWQVTVKIGFRLEDQNRGARFKARDQEGGATRMGGTPTRADSISAASIRTLA